MDDTSKYLIHARATADGIVERSDVVGAIFGQTEGLLGDDLDLRDLQQSSKVGRIDVEMDSENGQSFGRITIASSLDRVETAILAASLETITRVGPCQARVEVFDIEDVREAKRREVVERAKELLADSFDDTVMTSAEILEEVRESVRVEDITEYHGLPAGPRVTDSDAIILVEGRADVLRLLRYGVKNAIAVEGTNVPDPVADLTRDRTVTAFLDGDRGGELILRELQQVGEVDYVAFAPENRSVEDLNRREVMSALREKVPVDRLPDRPSDAGSVREATGTGNGAAATGEAGPVPPRNGSPSATPSDLEDGPVAGGVPPSVAGEVGSGDGDDAATPRSPSIETGDGEVDAGDGPATADTEADEGDDPGAGAGGADDSAEESDDAGESTEESDEAADEEADEAPATLGAHVRSVVGRAAGTVRLLDGDLSVVAEAAAADAFETLRDAETVPRVVVVDGTLDQRLLDVAAQRGVEQVVAAELAEFVKQPVDVRVRTADQLAAEA
jgi:DNA primase